MKLLHLNSKPNLVLCVETVDDCLNTQEESPWYLESMFSGWYDIQHLPADPFDLTVDFGYCNFLSPDAVAFLGGVIRQVEQQGGQVTFRWDTLSNKVRMNLAQNGFLQSFDQNQSSWDGNSIPYRCDLNHNEVEITDYLRYKWLGKGWVNVSPVLRDSIVGQVQEIYLNAFDHSQTKVGVFSCGQHYPNLGILQLTVVDFGLGIPTTVRSIPQNSKMSSAEALNWAFQPGNSTRKESIPGGMGLSLLQDFITLNHGSLMIFSNDRQLIINDNGIKNKNRCINFSGTLVNIQLRCDEAYN